MTRQALLDTQVVLWLAREPYKLSKPAVQVIREIGAHGERLAIATATLYEIAWLARKGKLTFHSPLENLLGGIESTYCLLPLTAQIALQAIQFTDSYPRDPADRQIGATAVVHRMPLITADGLIQKSGEVPCIW